MIKFRAWHSELNMMFEVKSLVFTLNLATIASKNDLVPSRTCSFDDIILMQSIGLYDNTKFKGLSEEEQVEWLESGKTVDEWQGREIFEGDIVKIIYDSEPFTGVVVYDLGETDFKATNNREEYGNNFQYLTVGESIKVIGNVHQHPELLEENK